MPSIADLLQDPSSLLGKLVNQAQSLENLQQLFTKILDPAISADCRIGDYQLGVLTLFVKNGAMATQLRYQVPDLLSTLRKIPTWAGLVSIQVKVSRHWPTETPVQSVTEPQKMPPHCVAQFEQLIQTLANEPGCEDLVNSLNSLIKNQ
jgi:hypothetical protein